MSPFVLEEEKSSMMTRFLFFFLPSVDDDSATTRFSISLDLFFCGIEDPRKREREREMQRGCKRVSTHTTEDISSKPAPLRNPPPLPLSLSQKKTKQNSARLPRVAVAWVRNYIAELALYFGVGGKMRAKGLREIERETER